MRTVQKILFQPGYLVLALAVAAAMIVFATWLPNFHLVSSAVGSETLTLSQKSKLLSSLVGSFQTNFTVLSQVVTIVTAVLAGVQISLFVYYLRSRAQMQKSIGMSFVGIVSSMLGIGCASCGSVILTSLIGLGSAAAVLTVLPLHGQEFGILGIGLLLFANIWLVRKIEQPIVCKPSES